MATLNPMPRRRNAGFTLVELVITVTIVGILGALALPSMRQLIQTQNVRSGASELQAALFFARSEAIKRAALVDVVPTGGKWEGGWIVQINGGATLRTQSALSGQLTTMTGSTLTYRGDGRLNAGSTPSPIVFRTSDTSVTARCVVVDLGGRPSVIYDTNGVPSDGCN